MRRAPLTHPVIGGMEVEYDEEARGVAFYPEHEEFPARVEWDDAPADWRTLGEAAMARAFADARAEGWR